MGAVNWIVLLLTHPLEFRTLAQYWLYHEQKGDIKALKEHETSGWDRETMRRCWHFLDLTSRSFAAVIKELDGDLARTVSSPFRIFHYVAGQCRPCVSRSEFPWRALATESSSTYGFAVALPVVSAHIYTHMLTSHFRFACSTSYYAGWIRLKMI